MEVIAAATTVCALCKSIVQWIDQLVQKEQLLTQISSSVMQLYHILKPFSSESFKGKGEAELSQAILAVGDALQRTKEHLVVWKYKKAKRIMAFVNPGSQIQQLQEDQKHINNQLIILLTAMAAVGYFRDHSNDSQGTSSSIESPSFSDVSTKTLVPQMEEMGDGDAKAFWRDYIGVKVNFVTVDVFQSRLQSWYQEFKGNIPQRASERMIMRLDEFNCGGITPYNLDLALEGSTLKEFVENYIKGEKPRSFQYSRTRNTSTSTTVNDQALRVPLLVWIDDCPENNVYEVSKARLSGIMVVELSSTAIAKAWIEENLDFLLDNDHPSTLRFISDNVRLESTSPNSGPFLNQTAGENFLQYLRARFFEAPVLIYTGASVVTTRYVCSYDAAGSTTNLGTCLRYILGLASGDSDDTFWRGFNVSKS